MKKYILQTKKKGYSCCFLISLLNACIYYDKPYITSLEDPLWEKMVDDYKCRYGSCLLREKAIENLNLKLIDIDRKEIPDNLPAMISSFTKVGFHSSLVVKIKKENWTIINYNGYKGKLISIIDKNSINFPEKNPFVDKHYKVELMRV